MASEQDLSNAPVIFADGIANFNNSTDFAKFYLYRWDPPWIEISGEPENKLVPAAQVVMPLGSAFEAVAFLYKAIENICVNNKEFAQKWAAAKKAAEAQRPI